MRRLILFLSLFVLVACGNQPENVGQLPTEFEIPTSTVTFTPSPSDSPEPGVTESPTAEPNTEVAGVVTSQVTAAASATITFTPSLTITDTPTPPATATPSETYAINLLDVLIMTAAVVTPMPTGYMIGGTPIQMVSSTPTTFGAVTVFPTLPGSNPGGSTTCQYLPPAGFGVIYGSDTTLPAALGCPIGAPPTVVTQASAVQVFERGVMVWTSTPFEYIYVLFNDGTYLRFDDLYNEAVDPATGGEIPPAGLVEPVRGFGKIWRTVPGVRDKLGWATQQELAGTAHVLGFERGVMINNSTRGDTLILMQQGGVIGGTWKAAAGQY